MSKIHIHMLAAGLWVAAGVLMIVSTVNGDYDHLGQWAVFVALIAFVPTGHLLLIRERLRNEHIARMMASEMCRYQREEKAVTRIK